MNLHFLVFCTGILLIMGFKASDPMVDFLGSLTTEQREKTLFELEDSSRTRWHYLPATSWFRAGISINELDKAQEKLLFSLLQSHLSESGYIKTKKIMDLENVLAAFEGDTERRDPGKYFIAVYGDPQNDLVWSWSLEGHHISLNFTIAGDQIAMVPRFFGANPAMITEGPRKGERTLAQEEDLGLKLVQSLSSSQKTKAIIKNTTFGDVVSKNRPKVDPLPPGGITMAELKKSQRAVLVKLIQVYLSAMPEKAAAQRMKELKKEDWDKIGFAWAGATELGKPHYYRVQGKTFLIEFDNTQTNANHIHSVWRDFDGDFGRDLIKEHYEHGHH